MKRKSFPSKVETFVLMASRRRCALCFGLDGDTTEKEGQIAHIDRNRANNAHSNAAWLCTKHHARYDTRSRQTKGHSTDELRAHQKQLFQYLDSPALWTDARSSKAKGPGVSLEVFDRRVPYYRTTIAFIREATNVNSLELQTILQFAADTDESLFLFDDYIARYLARLFKQSLQVRARFVTNKEPSRRTPESIDQQIKLVLWFSKQLEVTRRRFAPYLRLGLVPVRSSLPAGKRKETVDQSPVASSNLKR